jgi:hydrogenase maturation protein HypF
VSALCGLRARVNHEGQAAAELEAAARLDERGSYPLPLHEGRLDARETIRALVADLDGGAGVGEASARFHNALAAATAQACARLAKGHSLGVVVLSGGVFQNRLLLERTAERLDEVGLRVLVPRRLPPNDGGVAYGQAAVAASRRFG